MSAPRAPLPYIDTKNGFNTRQILEALFGPQIQDVIDNLPPGFKGSAGYKSCFKINQALTQLGTAFGELPSLDQKLGDITAALSTLKSTKKPNETFVSDIDENYIQKKEEEVSKFKLTEATLKSEYDKLLEKKLEQQKMILKAPNDNAGLAAAERTETEIRNLTMRVNKFKIERHQLESKLDEAYEKVFRPLPPEKTKDLPRPSSEQGKRFG